MITGANPPTEPASAKAVPSLTDLFKVFFVIGCTAFGGGASAHIHHAVVHEKRWLDDLRLLKDDDGFLVDPSILVTLRSHGFDVNAGAYLVAKQRNFPDSELFFVYEELPKLELLGLEASEPGLASLMALAMHGRRPGGVVDILLDVGWQGATRSPRGDEDQGDGER